MYADWSSLTIQLQCLGNSTQSVLSKLPQDDSKQVVSAVVKTVANNLGITVSSDAKPSALNTEQEVNWCMEVICHGLCLPLTEHKVISDSVNIYCEWLSALLPNPKICVPKPVLEDPNFYGQKIITHLNHLFIPRKGEEEQINPAVTTTDKLVKGKTLPSAQDTIHRQAVVCHRVLRRVQELAHQSTVMERETWEALLSFLLAINDALLSPPAVKGGCKLSLNLIKILNTALKCLDDIGDQLCERVLGVLFEIWLIACVKSFPSPTLWKTFREMCMNWRHRTGLVTQWNRVNLCLTSRLLGVLYGPRFPVLNIPKEDSELIPDTMTNECVAQSWFRFLNCIGNPVELSKPIAVSNTQQFKEYALKSFGVVDPTYHPCLASLPSIFLKAMKGVSTIVDAYLGLAAQAHSHMTNIPNRATAKVSIGKDQTQPKLQMTKESSSTGIRESAAALKEMVKTPIMREKNLENLKSRSDGSASNRYTSSTSCVTSGGPVLRHSVGTSSSSAYHDYRNVNRTISLDGSTVLEGLPRPGQMISTMSRSTSTSAGPPQNQSLSGSSLISTSAVMNSAIMLATVTGTLNDQQNLSPSPLRPSCNSILHLFGLWLFEAAFIGTDLRVNSNSPKSSLGARGSVETSRDQPRTSSFTGGSSGVSSQTYSLPASEMEDLPPGLTPNNFESGRAEALGALCRIFCSKRTGEEILPVYLARFYLAVQKGLAVGPDKVVSESLASILLNSSNLLRIDLDGVNVLAPFLVTALEAVLPEKEIKMTVSYINRGDLRRSAIHLLQSMLALPLHFSNMHIKELLPTGGPSVSFNQLKPRLVNLLINALQVETEGVNTHMLLGCLMLGVQDAASLEEAELTQNDGFSNNTDRNSAGLFNTASETGSVMSDQTNGSADHYHHTQLSERSSFNEPSIDMDNVADSAHALFVRATYLVCHRLISSWRSELNTSLAALEMLSGLARIQIQEQDALECKRAVKWLCDYIVTQCSRPPQAHSRDLHSSIVAAFQACVTWLVHHPYLLQDKECLSTVLEVVELGISGSKSQQKASSTPVTKDEKALNPASRRVREAAENLLSVIMEQVGHVQSLTGSECLSSLLDESSLLLQSNSWSGEQVSNHTAVKAFRYFVIDQSVVLGILEESLGNSQDPHPTVTAIIRCPSNKSVWTLKLRHLPRHKSGQVQRSANPGRPLAMAEPGTRKDSKPCFFPDSIEKIPLCAADRSIPAVDSIAGDETLALELDRLARLNEQQSILEKDLSHTMDEDTSYSTEFECKPPEPCSEFQTARLILSHLGFLSISALRGALDSPLPRLIALHTENDGFAKDIESLDQISPRTFDTMYTFYVRPGQTNSVDIISNSQAGDLNKMYLELLASLGWPVNVSTHSGWTGDYSTSWKIIDEPSTNDCNPAGPKISGPARFNGTEAILYWADVSSELAIIVPCRSTDIYSTESRPCSSLSGNQQAADAISTHSTSSFERGDIPDCAEERSSGSGLHGSLSLDVTSGESTTRRKQGRTNQVHPDQKTRSNIDYKVALVWLESMEDYLTFPVNELGSFSITIFVHPLSTGLLRIKLAGSFGKISVSSPLVDGMVVSRRSVGPLLRQTAINMCRRRRLEQDLYQPPHVRRKLKIQELVSKHRIQMSEPEFFANLFMNTSY